MIKSNHGTFHQERARMAATIGARCGGRDIHRDAHILEAEVTKDWDTMGLFLHFLQRTGCFPYGIAKALFSRWCSRTEATWTDEWKKWSQNHE